jgi:predicted HicB family RNase H-like nuclease
MFTVKAKKKLTVSKTMRFDEELYGKLQKIASKSGISVNNLILQCCEYANDNLPDENRLN